MTRDVIELTKSIVLLAVENSQNRQEQVDNIKVQADGRSNLLFDMHVPHDHLRVDENVDAEDQRCRNTVPKLHGAGVREERRHEAKQDQDPKRAEDIRLPGDEIVLCLTSKEREGDEDAESEDQCFENDLAVVETRDDTDAVRLECSEPSKEEQVGRIRFAPDEAAYHESDGTKQ